MALVAGTYKDIRQQTKTAVQNYDSLPTAEKVKGNLFTTILSSTLPPEEKDYKRMAQEGFSVLTASGDTIARTITTTLYHLLSNPPYLAKLRQELISVIPNPTTDVDLDKLENLPYFTAVLKESLRISALVTSRAVLQAPREVLRYEGWAIPPGTPVGMTLANLMMDPGSFPEPERFDPGRWLEGGENPGYGRNGRYFVPFHRGHRGCIGVNLAWAEMYIAIAMIMRRFDLELYDVVRERDVNHYRDCFLGEPRDDSRGVRVVVKGLLD